jgi:hypothetical protein
MVSSTVPRIIKGSAAGNNGTSEMVIADVKLDLLVASFRDKGSYGMYDGMESGGAHSGGHTYQSIFADANIQKTIGMEFTELVEKKYADVAEKEYESVVALSKS